jgi:hypothetical protein
MHLEKEKTKPSFRNNGISALVVQCYSFSTLSWSWYLNSSSVIVSPGGWLCWFSPGVAVGASCHLFAHLLVCGSQAGLEPAFGGEGALLLSQCKVAWRSFVQAGGLGCWSFASSWWFFSAKCGSSISAKFLICRAHSVCFLPLVAILDPTKKV